MFSNSDAIEVESSSARRNHGKKLNSTVAFLKIRPDKEVMTISIVISRLIDR